MPTSRACWPAKTVLSEWDPYNDYLISEKAGIAELAPAAGTPFNPEHHEAMVAQPSTAVAPNAVLQTIQKGYALNGRVLRPARVIVARAPDA